MESFHHVSILLEECLEQLAIRPDAVYIDATLGGAGHSFHLASRLSDEGTLLCIDRDDEALANAEIRLKPVRHRVRLCKSDFRELDKVLEREGFAGADGILFDLGVSSPQLDHAERGFSYMQDAPLDMRMDRQQALTAYDVVNGWEQSEIRRILFEYGEERYAPLIAAAIVRSREEKPIETTSELVSIIKSAMPAKALREKQHPAKRSFQAIRIAVNDELGAVAEAMDKAIDALNPGGRLAVITFHSLEDRIVKTAMKKASEGCTCPKDFPVCVCGRKPRVKVITRKPIVPDAGEVDENARARSAKLRVCEKL
ncbi:MAG: 16S rRNA (cytosine(1402)-N(4))-methyltransferase RsmH [Butyricicoccus sp.]|nr:16S rRNA (cytosine(1402)-N(4))-methyltransferase RsmH [Butyricicoccus sp.]MBQ8585427.1 16S rRNA (cytosine(1402)-N(4))-methyltransferase RsmH [Butyricicoccus sp.]